jgi:hypothetical protein
VAKKFHAAESHKRDGHYIKSLLYGIGVASQQRIRMCGEVVPAMEPPETNVLVHQTIVPIVSEEKFNTIN